MKNVVKYDVYLDVSIYVIYKLIVFLYVSELILGLFTFSNFQVL